MRVLGFGAVVEVEPGVEGLLHVSEMSGTPPQSATRKLPKPPAPGAQRPSAPRARRAAPRRADKADARAEDLCKEGDLVRVRIDNIDKDQKIRLSKAERLDVRPSPPPLASCPALPAGGESPSAAPGAAAAAAGRGRPQSVWRLERRRAPLRRWRRRCRRWWAPRSRACLC